MTLDQSLRMFKDGDRDVREGERPELHYDIFAGTINSLAAGGFREILDQEPRFAKTISDLEGPTNDAAPLIKALNGPDDALAQFFTLFKAISSSYHRLHLILGRRLLPGTTKNSPRAPLDLF